MNQEPETLMRRAAPTTVPPLDHEALQGRGRRRRRSRRAVHAGAIAVSALVAAVVVAPAVGGLQPLPYLGGQTDESAMAWPQGEAGEVSWQLMPAEEADVDEAPVGVIHEGCELWLAYDLAGGDRGGESICPPHAGEVTVQRVTVSDVDGELLDLLVVMAGDRRPSLRLDLFGGERLNPELLDLAPLEGAPPISLGVVPVAPGAGIDHVGR